MAKETVISSSRVNAFGSRFLTDGIDITQYERNPVLLYMHRRWGKEDVPIGRVENMRKEGDNLIGTPVFDLDDPFGKLIANKWDKGFLKMVSASLEPTELSTEPSLVLPGQTRATVTKSKLIEVSIVDIGANDDAVQLMHSGKVINLAAGEDSDILPLLPKTDSKDSINKSNNNEMKTIMLALGLSETATPEQAVAKINEIKEKADQLEAVQLAAITSAVDNAITAGRFTADKKEHFVNLGKTAGIAVLTETINLMSPVVKPLDVINRSSTGTQPVELKWGDLTPDAAEKLKVEEPAKYINLYKQEFGSEPAL